MKEITREDWENNPKPRMMWVWNDGGTKEKRLVVHCFTSENAHSSFVAENADGIAVCYWRHCAEIEEPRRMTNQELSWWLRDLPEEHREYKIDGCFSVYPSYSYQEHCEHEPCPDNILIRSNGGEWHEPLVEVE